MGKLYMSPPIWLGLGVLTGWVHVRPGLVVSVLWAVALYGMVLWIIRDVDTMSAPK